MKTLASRDLSKNPVKTRLYRFQNPLEIILLFQISAQLSAKDPKTFSFKMTNKIKAQTERVKKKTLPGLKQMLFKIPLQ